MTESNWLRHLQMREAGHGGSRLALGEIEYRSLQFPKSMRYDINRTSGGFVSAMMLADAGLIEEMAKANAKCEASRTSAMEAYAAGNKEALCPFCEGLSTIMARDDVVMEQFQTQTGMIMLCSSDTDAGKKAPRKTFKKRGEKRVVHHGLVHIQASFNNTQITITDTEGNVISWSSAGGVGFKGSRKGTPFAATQAALNAGNAAKTHGLRSVDVRVKGPGSGRESAIRALQTVGIEVKSIRDVTPIPHNGCRPTKRRRV